VLASHYIVHSLVAVLVRSFSCFALPRLLTARFSAMSSKKKSKRKPKCPGCGPPKDLHDFAVMGKHCEGPEEPDPDSDGIVDDMSPVEKEKTLTPVPSTNYTPPRLLLGALPQHTNRPLLPTATTTAPFSKNAIFHQAQKVVVAIQFQVPYLKLLKPAPMLILSIYSLVLKLSTTCLAMLSLEPAIGKRARPRT